MSVLKVLCDDEKLFPEYHSKKAAAIDLKSSGNYTTDLDTIPKEISSEKFVLGAGERVLVKTGLKVELPKKCFGSIRGRSGLSMKQGIDTFGGVIDEDYRGEIGVILFNSSKKPFEINKYDRVAQMIIQKYEPCEIVKSKDLTDSSRGQNGFGSSGK
ncbi:MAG: dUTP diphosphatase [archaeon]|jgi:dUTP pyrophosphatase